MPVCTSYVDDCLKLEASDLFARVVCVNVPV